VWTGREVVTWGGGVITTGQMYPSPVANGAVYDPAKDSWRSMAQLGAPGLYPGFSAVWNGNELLVWGGITKAIFTEPRPGAAYSPKDDKWRPLSTRGQPPTRGSHVAVWTGHQMIIAAGSSNGIPGPFAAAYDPAADRWSDVPDPPQMAPAPIADPWGCWSGREFLFFGPGLRQCMAYDPARATWTELPSPPNVHDRVGYASVWTGTEAVLWGGSEGGKTPGMVNTGVALRPGDAR
jgi:hypothetical protein